MERDFKGIWLPKELWLDKNLTALEKIIFAEIDSLDTEKGCIASNEYLAEFCQCGITKISNAINKLIELGYIYQESFNGRTRVIKCVRQSYKKCKAELQKVQGDIYNTKNNINSFDKNSLEKYIRILCYLNEKAGTKYRPVESNLKFIRARLKDYTEEDLKSVIDKKVAEWKGTDMQMYLRPETLFNATKFENYLNAPVKLKEMSWVEKLEML